MSITDTDLKTYLAEHTSAAVRCMDASYVAPKLNGISALYQLGWVTTVEQVKRVTLTLTWAQLRRLSVAS